MSVGEFTASNISMDVDARDEKKAGSIDLAKLNADIQQQKELAAKGQLHAALEGLLGLEKSSRLAEDITATKACCSAVLDLCFQARDWKLLEEHVSVLTKRRSQLKQAIQAVVRQAMSYVDSVPDLEAKVSLIKMLQAVTEGKIFVEIERARLTKKLARWKEDDGNIAEAADILQEVPVETFGAMAKTEKIAYILEQVRLCLDKKDYVRAQILSRKVSPKAFVERKGEAQGDIGIEGTAIEEADQDTPSLSDLKLKYYQLLIRYYAHNNNYLEVTRCYRAIYEVHLAADDPSKWMPVLRNVCWFLVLSPTYSTAEGSSSDRNTLLTATTQDKKLGDLPTYKQLLTTFTNDEIVRWPLFEQTFAAEIAAAATDVFSDPTRMSDLKLRVVEHNVLVAAKYYSQIRTVRLAQVLGLTQAEMEKYVADLVVCKAISAKIDRPAGIVTFAQAQQPEESLNKWAGNIGRLLELVDKSCQQIEKEAMVHRVTLTV